LHLGRPCRRSRPRNKYATTRLCTLCLVTLAYPCRRC